jgi:cleavage and polyadenylation specificity factor subunit 1
VTSARLVRNDYFSKPLAKGILDANQLDAFISLPIPRQEEITKQIGTNKETIIRDYIALKGVW